MNKNLLPLRQTNYILDNNSFININQYYNTYKSFQPKFKTKINKDNIQIICIFKCHTYNQIKLCIIFDNYDCLLSYDKNITHIYKYKKTC